MMKLTALSLLLGSTSVVTVSLDTAPLEESAYYWGWFVENQIDSITQDEAEDLMMAAERA